MRGKFKKAYFSLMLVALFLSCGGAGGDSEEGGSSSDTSSVRIILQFPDGIVIPRNEASPDESSPRATTSDIKSVTITVTDGFPKIERTFDINSLPAALRIFVPPGEDRLFTVVGRDAEGQPICRGQTLTDVTSGDVVEVTIRCLSVFEFCNDGIDNDGDFQTDCDDPDCDGSRCDQENSSVVCVCIDLDPTPMSSPRPTPAPSNESECADGGDDDQDGLLDCLDPDCDEETCSILGILGICLNGQCLLSL